MSDNHNGTHILKPKLLAELKVWDMGAHEPDLHTYVVYTSDKSVGGLGMRLVWVGRSGNETMRGLRPGNETGVDGEVWK